MTGLEDKLSTAARATTSSMARAAQTPSTAAQEKTPLFIKILLFILALAKGSG